MNQDQLYLKECPETRLDNHFTIEHLFVRSEHQIIFNSDVIRTLAKDPSLDIFIVPEPEAYTYNEDDVEQAYNIKQYDICTLYNLFAFDKPFKVNQVIVCKGKEVIAQRPSKISEEELNCLSNITIKEDERGRCEACGNTCCTCDPTYDSFQQSEYDKYYHLNQKVDAMEQLDRAVKQAPPEIHNSMPAYMLHKEPYIRTATFIKDDMSTFEFFKEFLNSYEYVYAVTDKFSVVHNTAYLVGADSSFSIEDYYKLCDIFYAVELNQDAKDRAAFMNDISKKEVQPPVITQKNIPVHPLATDMAFALILTSYILVGLVSICVSIFIVS